MVLFFAHIPFVVNHTINATPPERLQQRAGRLGPVTVTGGSGAVRGSVN